MIDRTYNWQDLKRPNCFNFYENKILKLIKFYNPKNILDIGSGNGYLCGKLKKLNFNISGIEPDIKGFNLSKDFYKDVIFYNISCYDNPNQINQKFDLIISTEVIEHLYYPSKLIEFSKKLLKPKGIFILTTPYHGYLKNLAISIINGWDKHFTVDWDGGHIKFWSIKTLNHLLIRHDFNILSNIGVGRLPFLWKGLITVSQNKANL